VKALASESRPTFCFTIAVVLLLAVFFSAQIVFPQDQKSVVDEKQQVGKWVRSFLNTWLVERNIQKAKTSFTKTAYTNEAMLQESCAGYIKAADRKSQTAISAGIEKFLQDFLPQKPAASLEEVLDRKAVSEIVYGSGSNPINNPESDSYIIVKLKKNQLPDNDSAETEFLRKHLPASDFYASFVPVGGGWVYFLWISEDNRWEIYHASVVCV
jgi:hypothetical protein